jgi:DNA-directed RNA polymerase subunit N (RpoN/RPB10)
MNKVLVRCWEVEVHRQGAQTPDCLLITYPEENSGHDLITCLQCGQIYAVTVAKEVYVGPPLLQKILDLQCVNCGAPLAHNYAPYPETYVVSGARHSYHRATELPSDESSVIKELYDIYE